MTKPMPNKNVFFAWQSDLPDTSNFKPIRQSIQKAIRKVGGGLKYDHATRGMPGSKNIADEIRAKIEAAEIVVADVSTIRKAHGRHKAAQNSNVVFELGLAVAHLGWEQVILLFNEEYGSFNNDIPFDFQSNRISKFRMPESPTADQAEKLNQLLLGAIKHIVDANPKRPAELKGKSSREILHERDSNNLRWMLEKIHWPTIDGFLEGAPSSFHHRIFSFHSYFKGVFENSLWYLDDRVMQQILENFDAAWDEALNYGQHYHWDTSYTVHIFGHSHAPSLRSESDIDWIKIEKACSDMRAHKNQLLDRIRTSYPEIDIRETNEVAWENYTKDS